jgi:hypothetical protein
MELLLRVLHVGVAAAWFGHKLLVPKDISSTVTAGVEQTRELLPRLNRAERLGQIAGVGTLLTGLGLAWYLGFGTIGWNVWTGLGLVLAAIVLGATAARPASNRFRAAVADSDRPTAAKEGRTLSRVLALESLIWTVTLALMLV